MPDFRKIAALAVGAIMLLADTAMARPDLRSMTCAQAQAMVRQRLSVVLTTGPHTFEKFVAGKRMCEFPYTGTPAWVKTRDNPSCLVGYRCEQTLPEGLEGWDW